MHGSRVRFHSRSAPTPVITISCRCRVATSARSPARASIYARYPSKSSGLRWTLSPRAQLAVQAHARILSASRMITVFASRRAGMPSRFRDEPSADVTRGLTVWLRHGVAPSMMEEASAKYPLETGGVLMGYWVDDSVAVVTQAIGPGLRADHQRHGFAPDQEWQTAKIAEWYRVSGRHDTYLGDWHTHPDETYAYLSRKDRAVLYRIATAPKARAPTPLMTVLLGSPDKWLIKIWRGRAARRRKLFPVLDLEAVVTKVERARS